MPRFNIVARPIVCRPPYLPLRVHALSEEQRTCVLAQWHQARVVEDVDDVSLRALAWVGTDTRSAPHALELVVAAADGPRRIVMAMEPTLVTSADIAREWRT